MFHKRLLKEFKDNQKFVVGVVVSQWISLLINIVFISVMASFISTMFYGSTEKEDYILLGITLLATIVIRGLMNHIGDKMAFQASTSVKERLREMIYTKLTKLGTSYHDYIQTSEAVQISTEGVEQLEIYFSRYVPQFFYSLLAPLTLFVVVSQMSFKVAIVLLLCVPLIPMSIVAVQKFAKKMLNKYWGTYTELGDSFLENLQGLTTLKIYEADERYAKKMDEEAEKFRKVTMRVLIMQLNSISIMDLVAYGGAAAGIILAILEYRSGNILMSQCFFIIMVSAEFFLPLRLLGSFFHIAMNGNAAANKIFKLLDTELPEEGTVSITEDDSVRFEHVTFGYEENKNVLDNISLEVKNRSFTALVGTSGCGKSTIASLIMGDHKVGNGSVLIGNNEVKDMKESTLNRKITRVRHDSYLFRGTVLDNLKMGNTSATEAQMQKALFEVDLWNTILEKGGLSMELTEKANNLSGGQKQRLALARAILHDSDIYIFDEATSNVDAESENKIMEAILKLAETKTVILISHRLANVEKADQILVMKEGKIVETGSHEELIQNASYYKNLYESQKELESFAKEAMYE